jgi:hypothetical protein
LGWGARELKADALLCGWIPNPGTFSQRNDIWGLYNQWVGVFYCRRSYLFWLLLPSLMMQLFLNLWAPKRQQKLSDRTLQSREMLRGRDANSGLVSMMRVRL